MLLQHAEIRQQVLQKIHDDMHDFPDVQSIIVADIETLFGDDVELREIWRAREAFGHEGDLLEWINTLPEPLRIRAHALGSTEHFPKEYLVTNEALECATILQRDVAKQWNKRLSGQLGGDDDDTLIARITAVQQYLGRLMMPRRNSTYEDLHARHKN